MEAPATPADPSQTSGATGEEGGAEFVAALESGDSRPTSSESTASLRVGSNVEGFCRTEGRVNADGSRLTRTTPDGRVVIGRGEQTNHQDVLTMSAYFAIDPRREPHLLWIVRQSIETPLPPDWDIYFDTDEGRWCYRSILESREVSMRRAARGAGGGWERGPAHSAANDAIACPRNVSCAIPLTHIFGR